MMFITYLLTMIKKYFHLLSDKITRYDKRIRIVVGTLLMAAIMLTATFYFLIKLGFLSQHFY